MPIFNIKKKQKTKPHSVSVKGQKNEAAFFFFFNSSSWATKSLYTNLSGFSGSQFRNRWVNIWLHLYHGMNCFVLLNTDKNNNKKKKKNNTKPTVLRSNNPANIAWPSLKRDKLVYIRLQNWFGKMFPVNLRLRLGYFRIWLELKTTGEKM